MADEHTLEHMVERTALARLLSDHRRELLERRAEVVRLTDQVRRWSAANQTIIRKLSAAERENRELKRKPHVRGPRAILS